jgi:hypothetical protein
VVLSEALQYGAGGCLALVGEDVLLSGEVKGARECARPAETTAVHEDRCRVLTSVAGHGFSPLLPAEHHRNRQLSDEG